MSVITPRFQLDSVKKLGVGNFMLLLGIVRGIRTPKSYYQLAPR